MTEGTVRREPDFAIRLGAAEPRRKASPGRQGTGTAIPVRAYQDLLVWQKILRPHLKSVIASEAPVPRRVQGEAKQSLRKRRGDCFVASFGAPRKDRGGRAFEVSSRQQAPYKALRAYTG